MTLAFFENRLVNNPEYLPYIQSTYTRYISDRPYNVYLIGSNSSKQALIEKIARFTFGIKR